MGKATTKYFRSEMRGRKRFITKNSSSSSLQDSSLDDSGLESPTENFCIDRLSRNRTGLSRTRTCDAFADASVDSGLDSDSHSPEIRVPISQKRRYTASSSDLDTEICGLSESDDETSLPKVNEAKVPRLTSNVSCSMMTASNVPELQQSQGNGFSTPSIVYTCIPKAGLQLGANAGSNGQMGKLSNRLMLTTPASALGKNSLNVQTALQKRIEEISEEATLGEGSKENLGQAQDLAQLQSVLRALIREVSQSQNLSQDNSPQDKIARVVPSPARTVPPSKVSAMPISVNGKNVYIQNTGGKHLAVGTGLHGTPNKRFTFCTSYPCRTRNSKIELKVVAQPEEQHRARYLKEGSRGAVKDREGTGFPAVKLFGYDKPVTLQVFIGTDQGKVLPHLFYQASKVAGKNSTPCTQKKIDGTTVITIDMLPEKDMTVSCDCVGILKERNVDVEQRLVHFCGTRSKKRSTRCRLIFRVSVPMPDGSVEILQTASTPVLCTQPPGIPEICKKSLTECPVNGEKELFIIGKNFLKDTQVIFRELPPDDSGLSATDCIDSDLWEVSADPEKEYLQPTHLVCRVPAYCRLNISSPTTVQFMVQSGGKTSEPHLFTYIPLCKEEKDADTIFKCDLPIKTLAGVSKNIQQSASTGLTSAFIQLPLLSPENHKRDRQQNCPRSLPALIIPSTGATILNTTVTSPSFLTAIAMTSEGLGHAMSVTGETKPTPLQLVVLPSLSEAAVKPASSPSGTLELASSVLEMSSTNLDSSRLTDVSNPPVSDSVSVARLSSADAAVAAPLFPEVNISVKDEGNDRATDRINFMSGIASELSNKFKSEEDPSWAPSTTVPSSSTVLPTVRDRVWPEESWGNSCPNFGEQLKQNMQVSQEEASASFARFCDQTPTAEETLQFKPSSQCIADVAPLFPDGDRFETMATGDSDFRPAESTTSFLPDVTMASTQDFSKEVTTMSMMSDSSATVTQDGRNGNAESLLADYPVTRCNEAVTPFQFRTETETTITDHLSQAGRSTILSDNIMSTPSDFAYGDCPTTMSNERIVAELNSINATLNALNTSSTSSGSNVTYIPPLQGNGSTTTTALTAGCNLITSVLPDILSNPTELKNGGNKDETFMDACSGGGISLQTQSSGSLMVTSASVKSLERNHMTNAVNTISPESSKNKELGGLPVPASVRITSANGLQQAPVPGMDSLSAMTMLPESELLRMINPSTFDNV